MRNRLLSIGCLSVFAVAGTMRFLVRLLVTSRKERVEDPGVLMERLSCASKFKNRDTRQIQRRSSLNSRRKISVGVRPPRTKVVMGCRLKFSSRQPTWASPVARLSQLASSSTESVARHETLRERRILTGGSGAGPADEGRTATGPPSPRRPPRPCRRSFPCTSNLTVDLSGIIDKVALPRERGKLGMFLISGQT